MSPFQILTSPLLRSEAQIECAGGLRARRQRASHQAEVGWRIEFGVSVSSNTCEPVTRSQITMFAGPVVHDPMLIAAATRIHPC